jgi:hypothetical protein
MNPNLTIINDTVLPEVLMTKIVSCNSQIVGFLDNYRSEFDNWFSNVLNCKIKSRASWVNYIRFVPGMLNGYEWHNEKGIGGAANSMDGAYAGIIWISGTEDCGGNLSVLIDDTVEEVKFKLNTSIVMPATMFHRVHHYHGSDTRISLNFTFDLA